MRKNNFLLDPFYRRGRVYKRKFCLCVCGSVDLSVITFSFFEYSMIWWFRPCKPYIFWKLIMLATSTALFWPSTTEYQPVPPSTDPVPPNTNQYRPIVTQYHQVSTSKALTHPVPPSTNQHHPELFHYHQVSTSTALYWPSTNKYQLVSLYTIHHLVMHSWANWMVSLFAIHLTSHVVYLVQYFPTFPVLFFFFSTKKYIFLIHFSSAPQKKLLPQILSKDQ